MSNRDGEKSRREPDDFWSSLESAQTNVGNGMEKAAQTALKIADVLGRKQNEIVENLTKIHVSAQYKASISPALARQYLQGRKIVQARAEANKSLTDLSDLNAARRKAVQTYQKLHSDLPSQIPFYNKEILARDLERDIVRRAAIEPERVTEAEISRPLGTADGGDQRLKRNELEPASKQKLSTKILNDKEEKGPKLEEDKRQRRCEEANPPGNALLSSLVERPGAPATKPAKTVVRSASAEVTQGRSNDAGWHSSDTEMPSSLAKIEIPSTDHVKARLPETAANKIRDQIRGQAEDQIEDFRHNVFTLAEITGQDSKTTLSPPPIIESPGQVSPSTNSSSSAKQTEHSAQAPATLPEIEVGAPVPQDRAPNFKAESIKDHEQPQPADDKNFAGRNRVEIRQSSVRLIAISQSKLGNACRGGTVAVAPSPERGKTTSTVKIPLALLALSKVESSTEGLNKTLPASWLKKPESNFLPQKRPGLEAPPKLVSENIVSERGQTFTLGPEGKSSHLNKFVSDGEIEIVSVHKNLDSNRAQNSEPPLFSRESKFYDAERGGSRPSGVSNQTMAEKIKESSRSSSEESSEKKTKNIAEHTAREQSENLDLVFTEKPSVGSPGDNSDAKSSAQKQDFKFTCTDKNQKYLSGPEIIFAAIIALAGTARVKTEYLSPVNSVSLVESINRFDETESKNRVAGEREIARGRPAAGEAVKGKIVFARPKILVSSDDTLVGIAEQLFNDDGIAWLMYFLALRQIVIHCRSRKEDCTKSKSCKLCRMKTAVLAALIMRAET